MNLINQTALAKQQDIGEKFEVRTEENTKKQIANELKQKLEDLNLMQILGSTNAQEKICQTLKELFVKYFDSKFQYEQEEKKVAKEAPIDGSVQIDTSSTN